MGVQRLATKRRNPAIPRHLNVPNDVAVGAQRNKVANSAVGPITVYVMNDQNLRYSRVSAVVTLFLEGCPSVLPIRPRGLLFNGPSGPARQRTVNAPAISRNETNPTVYAASSPSYPVLLGALSTAKPARLVLSARLGKITLPAMLTRLRLPGLRPGMKLTQPKVVPMDISCVWP